MGAVSDDQQAGPARGAVRDRRRDLGAFLRSRRARLRPAEVGLPDWGVRRVPGLRREEVAQLANVGLTWYTWLEQGRQARPSASVLTGIGDALRLDAHGREHLVAPRPVPGWTRSCRASNQPRRTPSRPGSKSWPATSPPGCCSATSNRGRPAPRTCFT